jgi:hypothetical protein
MKKFFVFTCAALLLIGLSVSAMAEVNIYGRVYMDTMVIDSDAEVANAPAWGQNPAILTGDSTKNHAPSAPAAGVQGNDDTDLAWSVTSISRLGFNFSAGKARALVELAADGGGTDMDYRHWYGSYDFGSFELLIGDTYSPIYYATSGAYELYAGGAAWGVMPHGAPSARPEMVRFKFELPNKLGQWYVALCEPNPSNNAGITLPNGAAFASTEWDANLPQLQTTLRLNFAPTSWLLWAGYQTYDEVGRAANGAETEFDVDAWTVGFSGSVGFGPLTLKGSLWMAENQAEFNGVQYQPWTARYSAVTNDIEDNDYWGFQATGVFKFNDMVRLEVGVQHFEVERPNPGTAFGDDEIEGWQYQFVLPIQIVKGWEVVPTVSFYDHEEQRVNGVVTDLGETVLYGLTWIINF